MSRIITNPPAGLFVSIRNIRGSLLFVFLLTAVLTLAAYRAAGLSLGFFLAGPAILTITLPPLLSGALRVPRLFLAGVAIDTLAAGWLIVTFLSSLTFLQWLQAYCILIAFALALLGLHHALARLIPFVLASYIVTMLAAAWLTWPIWLSPHLHGAAGEAIVNFLVPAHPLFALNAIYQTPLGIWTENGVIYSLSNLNQDVPYALPAHPWLSIIIHTLLGVPIFVSRQNVSIANDQTATTSK